MNPAGLKVLVVEHDAAFASAVSGMLEAAPECIGCAVVVGSLEQAVARLKESGFDIILLEIFLPDGAGLSNIQVLRERAPHVPVIVFGAVDEEAFSLEAVYAGAQDYLVKSQLNARWLLRSIRYTMERHAAEMALVAAEEKYCGIFDHLVEGIFQTTPDGHYLMANAALARIYGYASPAELTRSLTNLDERLYVQPGRRDEFVRTMQEGDTVTGFESQVYRKDGSMIWISENCRAIRDAQGQLLYYEGTVEDITPQREAEGKLRDSEALYHSLVETLPQNIFRKDLQERFTFANQQFCATLGRRMGEILGKTDFDFFPAALAANYQRDDARVMATGRSYETVEEHQLPDGSKIYVRVVKTPLRGAYGQITGLQGIFWDITVQKLAEEQIRKANEELATSRELLRVKNLQMEEDLKMASEIQLTMLPQQYPTLPRHATPEESTFRFTHRYLPTGTVGGDFFSVTALSDTEVAVFICDVAGHGVRSALVTAMARALIEELRPIAHAPDQFLTKLNSELIAILKHSGTPVLTTAFYLVADSATGEMRYANAGHPKPLHVQRRAGKVETLAVAGAKSQPALGLFPDAAYRISQTTLAAGDLVMLFTDGLFEVQSREEDLYTVGLLAAATRKRLQSPSSVLFDELLAEIRAYSADGSFDDDVCLVGLDYTPRPDGNAG